MSPHDVERGRHDEREYKPDPLHDFDARGDQGPLFISSTTPNSPRDPSPAAASCFGHPRFNTLHLIVAFIGGVLGCGIAHYTFCDRSGPSTSGASMLVDAAVAPPWVGSTTRHHFPPLSPTNANPTLFPSDVGYPGGTKTGAEAAIVATAPHYPLHTGAAHLVVPHALPALPNRILPTASPSEKIQEQAKEPFDLLRKWGNLSPWYSVKSSAFGLHSSPDAPETCRITGLHLLHRHGARYPTAWASFGGPAKLATRLRAAAKDWDATGNLEFLNDWTYKLGEELLTPFGRQQLFDLGVSMRMKYGFLLENFTETNTIPVFRTESQDRMLHSALNFAFGFFGIPLEGRYEQSITIEADGFNNTLAPYDTCPNAHVSTKSDRSRWYIERWTAQYLQDARARLQADLQGFELTFEDIYSLQQTCAYETVAIGYSKFCELFTEEEWDGFDYALDLVFWYNSAFGSPIARSLGIGWVQELVARLTHTPIPVHNSSTNSTLDDNPLTFPLNQSIYVDATHEVVVLHILTALNLTTLTAGGPLPADHIPKGHAFKVSQLAPFATNVQFQLLECESTPGQQIRVIVNDGVVPLTGIRGCPEQRDGMCPVDAFVAAQKEIIAQTDWEWDCYGDWEVPEGSEWNTTTGEPPRPDWR